MYLIWKAWTDSYENSPRNAFGYDPYAATDSLEKAEAFCATGKTLTRKQCWAVPEEGAPEYKWQMIPTLAEATRATDGEGE